MITRFRENLTCKAACRHQSLLAWKKHPSFTTYERRIPYASEQKKKLANSRVTGHCYSRKGTTCCKRRRTTALHGDGWFLALSGSLQATPPIGERKRSKCARKCDGKFGNIAMFVMARAVGEPARLACQDVLAGGSLPSPAPLAKTHALSLLDDSMVHAQLFHKVRFYASLAPHVQGSILQGGQFGHLVQQAVYRSCACPWPCRNGANCMARQGGRAGAKQNLSIN